jgi:Mn-dependent DtxR family transcriptional regulator
MRLREIASALDITERSAFGIVTELADAGYVVKEKDGRRNRYQIQGHLPLREVVVRERTIGEVLDVLVEASASDADVDPPAHNADTVRTMPAWVWWRWSGQA